MKWNDVCLWVCHSQGHSAWKVVKNEAQLNAGGQKKLESKNFDMFLQVSEWGPPSIDNL